MVVSKAKFSDLFHDALKAAQAHGEVTLGESLSSNWRVKLYGAGCSGAVMDIESCLDRIFIGEGKFFKIIDVAVFGYSESETLFFVRASDHEPVPYSDTLDAADRGPFKVLEPVNIRKL